MNVFHRKYKKHFKFCSQLLSLAIQSLTLLAKPSKTYGEVITALFIKAINSFRSIMLLCKKGLGDDAGIILRSLLNLAYLVKWIEQEKEERVQRFFGWFCKEKIDLGRVLGKPPGKICRQSGEW